MHQTLHATHNCTHDATSHACRVDGSPCEVVAPFLPRLHAITGEAWAATLAPYTGCLPCMRCRAAGQVASRLPGQRTVERPARWWFTDAQGKRVAVRSEKSWPKQESYSLLTARLTPFGEALVAVYRDDLETGKPIRRDDRVAIALTRCRRSPDELLTTFAATVTGRMDGALRVAG